MRRAHVLSVLLAVLVPATAAAQQNQTVQQAQQAYEELRYLEAIRLARQALQARLGYNDQVTAYEVLSFAYAALDSTDRAIEGFKQLIFLDPDREPDVEVVAPRIVNAYTAALGDVLVVRRLAVDSTTFVAGQGAVPIDFEVSRPSRAVVRIIGQGIDAVVDSFLVGRQGLAEWRAVDRIGNPVPPGRYQVVVSAFERDNQHGDQIDVEVRHAAVDTVPHLESIPGQSPLPETEIPPRNWQPLGAAVLFAGLGAGASLALESEVLGGSAQGAVIGTTIASAVLGFIMSVRNPDPQPVPANIRYNQLLADELARRNANIAEQNVARRRQIRLTVLQVAGGAP